MIRYEPTLQRLQQRLDEAASTTTKEWWEAYMKRVITFRGVKMAGIRRALHEWYDEEAIADEDPTLQSNLALNLVTRNHAEDKLAGILMLHEILLPAGIITWPNHKRQFQKLFIDGHIYDWSTCDWLCVKVLSSLLANEGRKMARDLMQWADSEHLWLKRASVVPFAPLAKRANAGYPQLPQDLLAITKKVVRSSERFHQTAAGWLLRELSRVEQALVVDFLTSNAPYLSREGLRYATEALPSRLKKALLSSQ